jgi:hypothetical protein
MRYSLENIDLTMTLIQWNAIIITIIRIDVKYLVPGKYYMPLTFYPPLAV